MATKTMFFIPNRITIKVANKHHFLTRNLMFVVGATKAKDLADIRKIIPNHFLLVPGVGAQGGSLKEVAEYGLNNDCGLLVNASRAIIYADNTENFAAAATKVSKEYQVEMEEYL